MAKVEEGTIRRDVDTSDSLRAYGLFIL